MIKFIIEDDMKTAIICDDKIVIKCVDDIKLEGRQGAIVKVLGCGLCGSDIVKFVHKISKNGTVLGHEIVAQIVEINSETNFKVGDEIVTSHHIPCGKCVYCRHGNVSMCQHFKSTNIRPGGFSELVYLSEEHLQNVAHPMPKNLSEIEASFYEYLTGVLAPEEAEAFAETLDKLYRASKTESRAGFPHFQKAGGEDTDEE